MMRVFSASRLLVLVPMVLWLCAPTAHACSCARVSPCEATSHAAAVFIAQVTRVGFEQRTFRETPHTEERTFDASVASMRVEETFVGAVGGEVKLYGGGTTCDYNFKEGERYLVFARNDGQTLSTSSCSGTKLLARAIEDLDYLRGVARAASGADISGEVRREMWRAGDKEPESEPHAGVEVIFEGVAGRRFNVRSDALGRFELRGLPAGRYKIRTDPPTNEVWAPFFDTGDETDDEKEPRAEWTIETPARGCVNVTFTARHESEITGEVIELAGTSPDDLEVGLLPADGEPTSESFQTVKLDKQGRFRFKHLAPGRYFLGFNLFGGPFVEYPYPTFYFPGTHAREAAQIITLGPRQKLSGLVLPLPARIDVREIEGVAVLPDGRPAANTTVELTHPKTSYREGNRATTDVRGRFRLTGVEGQTYELSALVLQDSSLVKSKPLTVTIRARNKPVRLVVEPPNGAK